MRVPSAVGRPAVVAALLIVFTALALATFAGCANPGLAELYFLPTPRLAYVTDEFENWDDRVWDYGAEPGYPEYFDIRGGYYVAADPRQAMITRESYPAHLQVKLDWEIWFTDEIPFRDNLDAFDFRVILDTSLSSGQQPSGPFVSLKLSETTTTPARDSLILAGDLTQEAPAVSTRDTLSMDTGILSITFDRYASPPRVSAVLVDRAGVAVLNGTVDVPEGWGQEAQIMVSASGYAGLELRVLDAVHIFPLEDAP